MKKIYKLKKDLTGKPTFQKDPLEPTVRRSQNGVSMIYDGCSVIVWSLRVNCMKRGSKYDNIDDGVFM